LKRPEKFIFRSVKYKPRGVSSRRAAIQWILKNWTGGKGVLYFADDDNTYDLQVKVVIYITNFVSFPLLQHKLLQNFHLC